MRLLISARAFAALDFASKCMNWAVSSDHLPPSARPFPDNSGKVRSVLWRAAVNENSSRDAPLLAVPSLPRGQTRVVSIANSAPPKRTIRPPRLPEGVRPSLWVRSHRDLGLSRSSSRVLLLPCFPVQRRTPTRRSVSEAPQPPHSAR